MNTHFLSLFILILTAVLLLLSCQDAPKKSSQALEDLFNNYRAFQLAQYPEYATYQGDHRYDDRLTDLSPAAEKSRTDSLSGFLRVAESIDASALNDTSRVSLELFKKLMQNAVKSASFDTWLMPLGQQEGIHIDFPQIIETQPLQHAQEYDKYLLRLRGFPKQVADVIANMKTGIQQGMVPPVFIAKQVLDQVSSLARMPVEETPFLIPILHRKNMLTESDKIKYKELVTKEVKEAVLPAYLQLADFLKNEYLPHCRKDAGVWSLKNGKAYYAFQIENQTTLSLTPEQVFQTGLNEVSRLRNELEKIKEEIGFKGDILDFFKKLRTDPQFYYTSKDSMMAHYRKILQKMDTVLPSLFGHLPAAPYDLREMEDYRAKSAPQAYYYPAPLDRSRPGYFYVNTHDLPSRPIYTMTALALHEAVPGHHIQIALAQEIKGLPWFRQDYAATGFVEGWALYAEYLGYETGMYEDNYQKLGALLFEMWRACRLVVDVGLHDKRWTREQAVNFMLENTANSELDIRSEIDRYISWPGQALTYKMGELKIKELRKRAETTLGDQFDLKLFHDKLLENGAVPLDMLEANINVWISQTQRKKTT